MQPPRRSQPLSLTPQAREVLETVREHPGSNMRETRERTGLGRVLFETVLDELVRCDQIHRHPHGNQVLLFSHLPGLQEVTRQLAVLRDTEARAVYRFLYSRQEIHDRQEVVRRVHESFGWEETRTCWLLKRLQEARLVKAFHRLRDGRCVTYRFLPVHPMVEQIIGP